MTIAARALAAIASAATGLLVPRALSLEQYGQYGIAVGVAGILVILSDLGLTTSSARSIAGGQMTLALLGRVAVVRLIAALAAASLLVMWGIAAEAAGSTSMEPAYVIAAAGFVLAASAVGVASGLLPALREIRALTFITVLQPVLEVAAVAGAIALGLGGRGIILASASAAGIAGLIGIAVVIRALHRAGLPTVRPTAPRELFSYGRAMFIVGIAFSAFGQVDQLMLWAFHGAADAAPYIACWRLVTLLHLPGFAAATVIAPRLARAHERERREYLAWTTRLAVTYVGGIAIAGAVAPQLVPALLGPRYADAGNVLRALSLYAVLLGIAPLVTMTANYLGGARERVRLGLAALTVNIVLDLALVPPFGVYGAAIATSVAFLLYMAGHARLTWGLFPRVESARSYLPDLRVVAATMLLALGSGIIARPLTNELGTVLPDTAAVLMVCAVVFGLYSLLAHVIWRGPISAKLGTTTS